MEENLIEGIENVRQSVSVYFLFCIQWSEKAEVTVEKKEGGGTK